MSKISFTLNGQPKTLSIDDTTPLLWVIRDYFGLTGTKYSCGMGICGSCTVHINGQPKRSCRMTVSEVAGKDVLTIEGLGVKGLHPVQQAWVEEEVAQCGYCQSGQIMTAVALLNDVPDPTDEEIIQAMNGVLCRCGSYQRIRKAIHKAAEEVK
ncbi:MAG: (2Fe-2S)-binding protein [Candidatus Marinimicrobia bacterium]|nr:(2Fe-2S)-binding protein [Candidatus Neomarinimicrobiota bacterium]